jgi:hypothetical protein
MPKPKPKQNVPFANEWKALLGKNWKRDRERLLLLPDPKDPPPVLPAGGKVTARFVLQCLPRRSRSQITPDRVNHWVEQFAHRRIKTTADVLKFVDDLWKGQNGMSRWQQRKLRKEWEKKIGPVIKRPEKIPNRRLGTAPRDYLCGDVGAWDERTQRFDVGDRESECPAPYFRPDMMSGINRHQQPDRVPRSRTYSEPSPDGGRRSSDPDRPRAPARREGFSGVVSRNRKAQKVNWSATQAALGNDLTPEEQAAGLQALLQTDQLQSLMEPDDRAA